MIGELLDPPVIRPVSVGERLIHLERRFNDFFEICVGVAVFLLLLFIVSR